MSCVNPGQRYSNKGYIFLVKYIMNCKIILILFVFLAGISFGEINSDRLSRMLESGGFTTKEMALKEIIKQKAVNMTKNVISVLKSDPDEKVRVLAAVCLGKLGSKEATAPLFKAVENDKSVEVKGAAIAAIGDIKDKTAADKILELLKKDIAKSRHVKVGITYALGRFGLPKANLALVKLLEDVDTEVRKEAVRSLERSKYPDAQFFIVDLAADDPDMDVRSEALDVLTRIGSSKIIGELEIAAKSIKKEKLFEIRDKTLKVVEEIKKKGSAK